MSDSIERENGVSAVVEKKNFHSSLCVMGCLAGVVTCKQPKKLSLLTFLADAMPNA